MDVDKISISIKNAAQHLFRRYGYHKTSVNEIAAKANLAKATIYKYFESKELILNAIIMDYLDKHIQELAASVDPNQEKLSSKEISDLILKASRLTYTACNEFIGWEFIRESANAQAFLKNLSNEIELLIMGVVMKVRHVDADSEQARRTRFLVSASKSIVFSFAFTSVTDADVKKNFIQFRNEILPYLIRGAFV
ncbi:TetR/AcrR family transcriptional regulator [Solitalea canadensis]|uniref:Transcriptional regulator n=1 Tax=Solitalea canadensis (strain ATCC 29591 / DSM 3403 / JCM 21819 / LMG 8368 / NBRC 15130 / NCIMB 12057 / USAM 9D) TaxID=929556 RepID=H8KN65_SOLCM|nr:TetR/AcrR family transcriptional regulator [Solitalea canadensis]AFD09398.1 transcriptional regulator [Solitalea canadensis DSM 3403]